MKSGMKISGELHSDFPSINLFRPCIPLSMEENTRITSIRKICGLRSKNISNDCGIGYITCPNDSDYEDHLVRLDSIENMMTDIMKAPLSDYERVLVVDSLPHWMLETTRKDG